MKHLRTWILIKFTITRTGEHILHNNLCRPCSHIELPPHSLHEYFSRPCSHIELPPHSLHLAFSRPCSHRDIVRFAVHNRQVFRLFPFLILKSVPSFFNRLHRLHLTRVSIIQHNHTAYRFNFIVYFRKVTDTKRIIQLAGSQTL